MDFLTQLFFFIILQFSLGFFIFQSTLSNLLVITLPIIIFYPFNYPVAVFSVLIAFLLYKTQSQNPKTSWLSFFALILSIIILSSCISPRLFIGIANPGPVNLQRGEHQNFQQNQFAKLLHNKTSDLFFYTKNISDHLSPANLFGESFYPNFSHYLPIAYLFPWYLLFLLLEFRANYQQYFRVPFLLSLIFLVVLVGSSAPGFAQVIIFTFCFYLSYRLANFPTTRKFIIPVLVLNVFYLLLFLVPSNYLWDLGFVLK